MLLNSARSLKQQLLCQRESRLALRGTVLNDARLTTVAQAKFARALPLAMGITEHRGQHRLAIRIHYTHAEIGKLVDTIYREARGEVDIKIVGRVGALAGPLPKGRKSRRRPLAIGDSVGLVGMKAGAGTIGGFVESATDRHLVLSNNHVLAEENQAKPGAAVLQPGPADGGKVTADRVASLQRFVRLRKNGNRVDAALAGIEEGVEYYPTDLGDLGTLRGARSAPLHKKEPVAKIGRSSGTTRGRISAFEIDGLRVMFPYPTLTTVFDNQLEVEPLDDAVPFSLGGDSGSLVVDRSCRAVGLLFAGNDTTATYLNPIQVVLDALKVKLAT